VVQLLSQVVYETNADVTASHEVMVKNPLVVADKTEKGLLWFKFKENRTVFLLSPLGKLQVKWNDVSEKRTLFRLVKNLLVAKPSEKLAITPLKQQTWIEYPVPNSFRLYWCDQATEFVVKAASETKHGETKSKTAGKRSEGVGYSGGIGLFESNRLRVRKALEVLRHELRFFREPTSNEVALRSGFLDESLFCTFLDWAGWKSQPVNEAKWVAERAINLASWLCFKDSGDLNPKLILLCNKALDAASMSVIERARIILKNYPGLVPKIGETGLRWSDEAKAKWIQAFGCEPPPEQTWDSIG